MGEPELREPQFPAPSLDEEEGEQAAERLPEPPEQVRRLMAAHLREQHGRKRFRLTRDVHLGGPRLPSQQLTWLPAQSQFLCQLCPGVGFWSGDWTAEMLRSVELWDESARARLTGIHDLEERDLVLRMHVDGTFARAELERAAQIAQRAAATHNRPRVAERRRRLQLHMLDRYQELGSRVGVVDETYALQQTDKETWRQLAGRPLSRATIESYWDQLSAAKKLLARRRFERGRR